MLFVIIAALVQPHCLSRLRDRRSVQVGHEMSAACDCLSQHDATLAAEL